jgi:hypothetical protein
MGSWLAETRIPGIAKGARLRSDDGRHSASNGIERVRESKTTPVEIWISESRITNRLSRLGAPSDVRLHTALTGSTMAGLDWLPTNLADGCRRWAASVAGRCPCKRLKIFANYQIW